MEQPLTMKELYTLYQGTAEKVSERRAAANTWMLSVNSALVALYGVFEKVKISSSPRNLWLVAIPFAGVIICSSWWALLVSYQKLNQVKFTILIEMEQELPFGIYTREEELLSANRRKNLSTIERWIPGAFIILYLLLLIAAVILTGS